MSQTREQKAKRNEDILTALKAGESYEQVADRMYLKVQTVKGITKQLDRGLYDSLKQVPGRRPEDLRTPRNLEMINYLFSDDGLTLEDVGNKYNITRERVRQLAVRIAPDGYSERRKRIQERRAEEKRQKALENAFVPFECPCCGEMCTDERRRVHCSERCYRVMRQILRYHIDTEYRDKHREYVSDWVLNHPDEVDEVSLAHAERVKRGEHEIRGRWFTKNSKALNTAAEAYRNSWPVFDMLPDALQQQVKEFVDGDDNT